MSGIFRWNPFCCTVFFNFSSAVPARFGRTTIYIITCSSATFTLCYTFILIVISISSRWGLIIHFNTFEEAAVPSTQVNIGSENRLSVLTILLTPPRPKQFFLASSNKNDSAEHPNRRNVNNASISILILFS